MPNHKKDYKLTYCGCCLLLFCGIALFLPFSLKYFEIGQISEETCHINHINYPTHLPTHGNTTNWETCDCGRRCLTWSPCIQLFSTNYPSTLIKENILDDDTSCTFHEIDCIDGENLQNAIKYLDESLETYNQYYNKTVTCYVSGDIVALNNDLSKLLDLLIAIASFMMIGIILIVCNQYYNCKDRFNKKSETSDNEVTVYNTAYSA